MNRLQTNCQGSKWVIQVYLKNGCLTLILCIYFYTRCTLTDGTEMPMKNLGLLTREVDKSIGK